jgi:hypothetical protein
MVLATTMWHRRGSKWRRDAAEAVLLVPVLSRRTLVTADAWPAALAARGYDVDAAFML